MPFRFLRLPLLPALEIVKSMNVPELLHFFASSPKYTIPYTRSLRIRLTVTYGSYTFVTFQLDTNPETKFNLYIYATLAPWLKTIWTLSQYRMPVENSPSHVTIFWPGTDKVTAIKLFVSHFARNFKAQAISFELYNNNFGGSEHVLLYSKRLQLKFERVRWAPRNECSVETEKRVLELCADASELIFHSTALRGLSFDDFQNCKMNTLLIVDPYWLTAKNLCDMMGCRKVALYGDSGQDIKLSLPMMKHFLKRWIEGGRLEWFTMRGYGVPDMAKLLEGFNCNVIEPDKQYEIQRADGTRAMLLGMYRLFRMHVIDE